MTPQDDDMMWTIKIDSQKELHEAVDMILEMLRGRRIIAFYGPMGAGKTTLIRELCDRLGVTDTVTSPTFAIINQYMAEDGAYVNHFDFYRIHEKEEAFDIGYEEYFYGDDLCLIEWPEKIEELLPPDTMNVVIMVDPDNENGRYITIG